MSFQDPNAFYEETLLLLDKNEETPTTITEGQVIDGDLTPFRHKMEAVNTGNQLQNSGVITLRVPPDGTFVRKEPLLVDETAKDDYIIQFQMKQDRDKDGIFEEEGKLFRFFIGQPTIRDDPNVGETLQITLIPVEYRTRETLDSERLFETDTDVSDKRDPFVSSKDAFSKRLFNYNLIKGTDNTQLLPGNNTLEDAPKLEWRPLAPTSTHDLFRVITERQALSGVEGGLFKDFFFDYESFPASTRAVTVRVEQEGTTDSGVILDPLTFDTSDAQKDNTINVDLIKFKNNVIAQGSPTGGSLPRENTVFSSLWEHGKIRPSYDNSQQYFSGGTGSGSDNQSEIRINDDVLGEIRFFKAIQDNQGVNPLDDPARSANWTEDFVTIPEYSEFASYNEKDVVTETINGDVKFFKAERDIDVNQGEPSTNADWEVTLRSFPEGFNHELFDGATATGLNRAGRTKFFSYTPWTSDFEACRVSCLFGDESEDAKGNFEEAGYQGVVPDWNYVRAVYDREVSDSRFENPVGKEVQKRIQSTGDIKVGDRHFGNRWYIGNTAQGGLIGHQNQIVEWVGNDFITGSVDIDRDLRFSRDPEEGETIVERSTGDWLFFSGDGGWKEFWRALEAGFGGPVGKSLKRRQVLQMRAGIYKSIRTGQLTGVDLLHDDDEFGNATKHSPMHIIKDIKLVEGASGVPGQAFEMRYDWSVVEDVAGIELPLPNADRRNYSSLGAWWFMMFPFPKIEGFGRQVGDVYKRPYIDTNNLDFNSNNKEGWNLGLDSEDLGRIQRISFKARLSLIGSATGELVIGYHDMPMKMWAVDIFDRVWFADFQLRRNGEYTLVQLSMGENSIQQLHRARYDELIEVWDNFLDINFFLQEKEWTGIEFDWRFIKAMGMFYHAGYNSEGLYVANQLLDWAWSFAEQIVGQTFAFGVSFLAPQGEYQAQDFLVNNARLAVDELHFEKQAYANSDRAPVADARTVLDHLAQEQDYVNLSVRAQSTQARREFVEQAWYMTAHGDVRLRFGEKFVAEGPRVPTGSQDLVCKEVKHIIDGDGYMMQIIGKRKFEI